MRRTIGVCVGVILAVIGPAGPAPAQTSGSHGFRVVFTGPPSTAGRVVSTGVVKGAGTVVTPEGQPLRPFPAELVLDRGTVFLTVSPVAQSLQFNPLSCTLSGTYQGTYQIDAAPTSTRGPAVAAGSRAASSSCSAETPREPAWGPIRPRSTV